MADWLKKLFLGSCSHCRELEERLYDEINSNRQREDGLVAAVVELSGSRGQLHRRSYLLAPTGPSAERPESQPVGHSGRSADALTVEQETQLEAVASQFITAMEERGTPYTEDAKILLREAIRRDPDKYLY